MLFILPLESKMCLMTRVAYTIAKGEQIAFGSIAGVTAQVPYDTRAHD